MTAVQHPFTGSYFDFDKGSGTIIDPFYQSNLPRPTIAVIMTLQTNVSGSTHNTFSNQPCTVLDVCNNTDVDIEYRRGGTGNNFPIPAGTSRTILGITNANQISIRRIDQTNTQITINAEALG